MKKVLSNRTTLFIVFALAAVALMGATISKPTGSDLYTTADKLAEESNTAMKELAVKQPGTLLRANIVK